MDAPGEQTDFVGLFETRGLAGVWVNGVYSFDQFHATAHEAPGCVSGWALMRLGGPEGEAVSVSAGDAVLLPAGRGHRNLQQSEDFRIVGVYLPGQSPDMQRGDMNAYPRLLSLARSVRKSVTDPVTETGGAPSLWRK